MKPYIVLVVSLVLLAGCAADLDTNPQPALNESNSSGLDEEDACGAEELQSFVGEPVTALSDSVVADARVIRPGDAVTMDYRPDRLNVYLDADDVIERIVCG